MEIQKYHQPTNGRTDRLTWVGARDACASKNRDQLKTTMCTQYHGKGGGVSREKKTKPAFFILKAKVMAKIYHRQNLFILNN